MLYLNFAIFDTILPCFYFKRVNYRYNTFIIKMIHETPITKNFVSSGKLI